MYCPKCGAQVDNNAQFCGFCGAQIRKRISQSPKSRKASNLHANIKSLKSILFNNIYRIIAIILLTALILIFVSTCIHLIQETTSSLSNLNSSAAALGTVLFMFCCIVPSFLSLQAIRSLLFPVSAKGSPSPPVNDRSAGVSKTAYFQIISILLVCMTITVFSFIYDIQAKNDMASALQNSFTSYRIPALIGIVLGILAILILVLSRKTAAPSKSTDGNTRR